MGAAVGSAATLGAAIVSGRAQTRSQHAQWARQHRRDAYVRYLGALHDRDIAMDAVIASLRPDEPDHDAVEALTDRFVSLAREVHRACEIVLLEGPAAVTDAAEHVTRASGALSHVVQRAAAYARAGDTVRKTEELARAAERERALYRTVKDFRLTARRTLDRVGG
nr:proline dehydrogenase [Streptomyces sp. SID5785]